MSATATCTFKALINSQLGKNPYPTRLTSEQIDKGVSLPMHILGVDCLLQISSEKHWYLVRVSDMVRTQQIVPPIGERINRKSIQK